jgi:hypothetical protein
MNNRVEALLSFFCPDHPAVNAHHGINKNSHWLFAGSWPFHGKPYINYGIDQPQPDKLKYFLSC